MLKTEQLTAMALERVSHDRYLLAKAVGIRAKELANGAKPYVKADYKLWKFVDIALSEIAHGKIEIIFER